MVSLQCGGLLEVKARDSICSTVSIQLPNPLKSMLLYSYLDLDPTTQKHINISSLSHLLVSFVCLSFSFPFLVSRRGRRLDFQPSVRTVCKDPNGIRDKRWYEIYLQKKEKVKKDLSNLQLIQKFGRKRVLKLSESKRFLHLKPAAWIQVGCHWIILVVGRRYWKTLIVHRGNIVCMVSSEWPTCGRWYRTNTIKYTLTTRV